MSRNVDANSQRVLRGHRSGRDDVFAPKQILTNEPQKLLKIQQQDQGYICRFPFLTRPDLKK